jgi:hypothetical protein
MAPFRDALQQLGYAEGRSVDIDYRSSNGNTDGLAELAQELVRVSTIRVMHYFHPAGMIPLLKTLRASMLKKAIVVVLSGIMIAMPAPGMAQTTTVQITGAEVQNFCIFDGSVFSAGSTICNSMRGPGQALTCRAKGTKVTPPTNPATTYSVATWASSDDGKCAPK